ncbi:DUF4123 domain-containing protein [Larsenimonas suaedae]|uniref:DUF4123 domain-containing protein n=1 Tax=Larsenimonas suaedae TaxID=1851019 RepID=A0ABU1GVR9_9GAMM|nr:DUF4123 domain-containing protein [Larsenimonas suaedae]MCM2973216.1 DUF4123 domain-containing protein [Larsenimonas suaedae]MDR5896109.1 DUF4123 domain-containing protein [Larsenimonas suaedae]
MAVTPLWQKSRTLPDPRAAHPRGHTRLWHWVIDPRRAPREARALHALEDAREIFPLLAGTPLADLQASGPLWVQVPGDGPGFDACMALAERARGGWCFLPETDVFETLLAQLQGLLILPDPLGGESALHIEDPATISALLMAATERERAAFTGPLGELVTPTPHGAWRHWFPSEAEPSPRRALTRTLHAALNDAHRRWWLAERQALELDDISDDALGRLSRLNASGITQRRHLMRLMPLIIDDRPWTSAVEAVLDGPQPGWQKVQALAERLDNVTQD